MVSSCAVTGCKTRWGQIVDGKKMVLFRFPLKNDKRLREWLIALNKGDLWRPNNYSRICSRHFVNGRPANEQSDVDFVPTIFDTHTVTVHYEQPSFHSQNSAREPMINTDGTLNIVTQPGSPTVIMGLAKEIKPEPMDDEQDMEPCVRYISSRHGEALVNMVKSTVPALTSDMHKGQSGRVAVIGGSLEYTGAPYYAAITSLKVGADLSHVFCSKEAGPVIKSYSPELIVHPILDSTGNPDKEITETWLPRIHAIVIGPGLGRSAFIFDNVIKNVIDAAKQRKIPIVIDADGLFFINTSPEVIHGYTGTILTPNIMEFQRLYQAVFGENPDTRDKESLVTAVKSLSEKLGNVTILCKGQTDVISDGVNVLECSSQGSARRCGGQGDVLSGSIGTFAHWANKAYSKTENSELKTFGPTLCAAYAGCMLTRECNRLAFQLHHRSMTTTDMIPMIPESFNSLFEDETKLNISSNM